LQQARTDGDVIVVMAHAKAMTSVAERMADGPEADALRRSAFTLFGEAARMTAASAEQVKEALSLATRLMALMPRTLVQPWLDSVFADEALTRIEAEVLALQAARLGDEGLSRSESSQMLVCLSHAVEAMLAAPTRGTTDLGIPLRMLTNAVSTELEAAVEARADHEDAYRMVPFAQLLQAAPSPAWLDVVEPSVATRATRAAIAVAIADDNVDAAVERLRDAMKRSKADAPALAEQLLVEWGRHLATPRWGFRRETSTRGRQERQLGALHVLVGVLRELDVDAKQLSATVGVFAACHEPGEVYLRSEIESIFGPLEQIPPLTACDLVDTMRNAILHYWQVRTQPPSSSTGAPGNPPRKTPTAELSRVVNNGYDTALALVEAARANAPGFWRVDAVGASTAYDRLKLNERLGELPPGRELELLGTAFAAFDRASSSYADALGRNEQVETSDIYSRWFRAALGASDTSLLKVEDLPSEGSLGDTQFDRIRAAIRRLPDDVAWRHTASFAEEIVSVLGRAPPPVKPRLVRAALQVVADHPAGAPLRKLERLYVDLVKNDMRLRLTIDGAPRVELGKPFALLIALRYTRPIERSVGGFDQYLQNLSGYTYGYISGIGYYSEPARHRRDELEREIREALSKSFEIQGLAWFEPATPGEGVIEDGAEGWLQKPLVMAYLVPKDASIDQVPQIKMQLDFYDGSGRVTVVLPSNAPSLVVSAEPSPRPCAELDITQTIDSRNQADPKSPEIELEVVARGRGTVPELRDMMERLEQAAPGWRLAPEAIDTRPMLFPEVEPPAPGSAAALAAAAAPQVPDETLGVVKPLVERSWVLHYTPDGTAPAGHLTLPTLRAGLTAKLANRAYGETDLENIDDGVFDLEPAAAWRTRLILGAALVVAVGGVLLALRLRRGRASRPRDGMILPRRWTPLAVITTLRRWQAERAEQLDEAGRIALSGDIRRLEAQAFGPASQGPADAELRRVLTEWEQRLSPLEARRMQPAESANGSTHSNGHRD
jgi:hypothetical protein